MKTLMVLALLLVAQGTRAQTARVIPLSSEDAQIARAKWDALQAAQKAWDAEQDQIAKKYTYVKRDDPDASGSMVPEAFSFSTGYATITTDGLLAVTIDPCKNPKTSPQSCADKKKAEDAERYFRQGFESGFEFDKNFLYLVPKAPEIQSNSLQPCIRMWQ